MADISGTKFKLGEAMYFLDQMKNTEQEFGPFLFNLSAHLSAAASIKDVMKNEFNRADKKAFDTWVTAEYAKLQKSGFGKFNNLRIRVVHFEGNLSRKIKRETVKTGEYLGVPTAVPPVNLTVGMPPSDYGNYPVVDVIETIEEKYAWHFKGKREAVITTCERYLGMLSEMVEEYEDRFWRRPTGSC